MKIKEIDLLTETSARIKIKRGLLWRWVMIKKTNGFWKLNNGERGIHDHVIALLNKS